MKRLQLWTSWMAAGGTAASVLIAQSWGTFADAHNLPVIVKVAAQLLVVGLATYFVRELAISLLTNSRRLRRLALGRQCVEGTWVDMLRDDTGGYWYGLCWIEPDNLGVTYHGINHDSSATPSSSFVTNGNCCEWPRLQFKYRNSRDSVFESEGFGELVFDAAPDGPRVYQGFSVDAKGKVSSSFGIRITDSSELALLNDITTRRETLLKVMARLQNLAGAQAIPPGNSERERLHVVR